MRALRGLADEWMLLPSSNGVFFVRYDGQVVWDYGATQRFPEPKEVREAILALSGKPASPPKHSGRTS